MNLTLINPHRITTTFLPEEISGKHWIEDIDEKGRSRRLASIEAQDGQWKISSYGGTLLTADGTHATGAEQIKQCPFNSATHIFELVTSKGEQVILLSEASSVSSKHFTKVGFATDTTITIGRESDNLLSFKSPFVSAHHATLVLNDESFTLTDTGSSNGVYVNEKAIPRHMPISLHFGDIIFIMGLKICVGMRFIAFNNPHNAVTLKHEQNQVIYTPQVPSDGLAEYHPPEQEAFYRSPRIMREITPKSLSLEDPPPKKELQDSPVILKIGPSVGMALASAMMGLYMISNIASGEGNIMRALPMLGMIVVMILGAVLWPNLSRRYEKKKAAKEESKRRVTYGAYLDNIKRALIRETEVQKEILEENRLTLTECLNRAATEDRRLFDRTSIQPDFLELRIGKGDTPLEINLKFPQDKLSLDEDVLKDLLDELEREPKIIKDVPLALALSEDYICGVVAPPESSYPFLRGLIAQIATLHAPDEVKIVYLGDRGQECEWSFIRALPHVFDSGDEYRYLASTVRDVQDISLRLERELQIRLKMNQVERPGDYGVYYVIICASGTQTLPMEVLTSLASQRTNKGFSIITVAEDIRQLPKECTRIIELDGTEGIMYSPKDATGKRTKFTSDISLSTVEAKALERDLARIPLEEKNATGALPRSLGLTEMFEAGSVEHLNVLTRWKQNDPTLSLAAPLGKDTQGNLSLLDVHEDAHGPHGLVAGMTGSGKSETIITYILSLAINYHPDEVSFVLIDYKGGGLAGAFDNVKMRLPHLAGTITNLDGSAITRSLVSIQSELKRRQALFNEAREIAGTSTIDIYKYQRLRRQGVVSEPCTHLFIIADEFAELKQQEPEFMDQLISTARIGRSLGVHLILATQKPSGVVNDQIWSNARFKICLKVADAADSKEMLKRPDAAELTDAGRYYLMVGYNEYFALGQSAWAGTPYKPKESYEPPKEDTVVLISNTARPLAQIKPEEPSAAQSTTPESVAILEHLVAVAAEEGLESPRLWLDPIPEHITVDELDAKYDYQVKDPFELNPIIGELDDPEHQAKHLLTLPLTKEGNAIIFGSVDSGVDACLCALLYSLVTTKRAQELNMYILDFGAEMLGAFRDAPTTGDIVFSGEDESLSRLFDFLEKEIALRRRLFSEFGGTFEHYCKTHTDKPALLIIINGISIFNELYAAHENRLIALTRDGIRAGINFIVTATAGMEVRPRVRTNFKQVITLGLADKNEYIGVLGTIGTTAVPHGFGRGLVKRGESILEFQAAQVQGRNEDEHQFIKEICTRLAVEDTTKAIKVPTLPSSVDGKLLSRIENESQVLPFGLYVDDLTVAGFDFEESTIARVCHAKQKTGAAFARSLLEYLTEEGLHELVFLDTMRLFDELPRVCSFETQENADSFEYLYTLAEQKKRVTGKPLVVFISGIAALFKSADLLQAGTVKDWLRSLRQTDRITVVIIDTAGEATYTSEEWFRAQTSNRYGLWVGEGLDTQSAIQVSYGVGERVEPSVKGSNWGYFVSAGKMRKVRLLDQSKSQTRSVVSG